MEKIEKEFKSFYKTVGGNEGNKCHYPTRLDTYGCGCQHDCSYCYAKSLLSFRGLWDASDPAVANIRKIENKLKKIPKGTVLRLGGMTDCLMPKELRVGNTYKTIELLNKYGIGYLIVTKSSIIGMDDYISILDRELAHVQVTVTTLDDGFYANKMYEHASMPSDRIWAIEKLQNAGIDVAIRLSPMIEEYIDFEKLNRIKVDKTVVEFLRINHWIEKWFRDIDTSKYVFKEGGYRHLPLDEKIRILDRIKLPNLTVCEDVTSHYEYWREHVNPNKDDCCNLGRNYGY